MVQVDDDAIYVTLIRKHTEDEEGVEQVYCLERRPETSLPTCCNTACNEFTITLTPRKTPSGAKAPNVSGQQVTGTALCSKCNRFVRTPRSQAGFYEQLVKIITVSNAPPARATRSAAGPVISGPAPVPVPVKKTKNTKITKITLRVTPPAADQEMEAGVSEDGPADGHLTEGDGDHEAGGSTTQTAQQQQQNGADVPDPNLKGTPAHEPKAHATSGATYDTAKHVPSQTAQVEVNGNGYMHVNGTGCDNHGSGYEQATGERHEQVGNDRRLANRKGKAKAKDTDQAMVDENRTYDSDVAMLDDAKAEAPARKKRKVQRRLAPKPAAARNNTDLAYIPPRPLTVHDAGNHSGPSASQIPVAAETAAETTAAPLNYTPQPAPNGLDQYAANIALHLEATRLWVDRILGCVSTSAGVVYAGAEGQENLLNMPYILGHIDLWDAAVDNAGFNTAINRFLCAIEDPLVLLTATRTDSHPVQQFGMWQVVGNIGTGPSLPHDEQQQLEQQLQTTFASPFNFSDPHLDAQQQGVLARLESGPEPQSQTPSQTLSQPLSHAPSQFQSEPQHFEHAQQWPYPPPQ